MIVGGHRYENDVVEGLGGKYVFGDWTKDPSRNEPLGRILAATPPEGFDGGGTATPGGDADAGNASAGSGNETAGNATGDGTVSEDLQTQDDDVVPRDGLWEMEEIVVRGGQEGTLGQFVRMFGRNDEGEIFVLANQLGRLLRAPESETGYVFKLVPPEEGEELPQIPDPLPGEEVDQAGPEGSDPAGNETSDPGGN